MAKWTVDFTKKAQKQVEALHAQVLEALQLLIKDLIIKGPAVSTA